MTNEPVDTASKERRSQTYHTTLLPSHDAYPDLITDELGYHFASIHPVNHRCTQGIVQITSPQNMNVGAWCENYRQFLLYKVSNIRNHSRATTNQHLCCSKKEKQEDKGKSMMHALYLLQMVKRHISS